MSRRHSASTTTKPTKSQPASLLSSSSSTHRVSGKQSHKEHPSSRDLPDKDQSEEENRPINASSSLSRPKPDSRVLDRLLSSDHPLPDRYLNIIQAEKQSYDQAKIDKSITQFKNNGATIGFYGFSHVLFHRLAEQKVKLEENFKVYIALVCWDRLTLDQRMSWTRDPDTWKPGDVETSRKALAVLERDYQAYLAAKKQSASQHRSNSSSRPAQYHDDDLFDDDDPKQSSRSTSSTASKHGKNQPNPATPTPTSTSTSASTKPHKSSSSRTEQFSNDAQDFEPQPPHDHRPREQYQPRQLPPTSHQNPPHTPLSRPRYPTTVTPQFRPTTFHQTPQHRPQVYNPQHVLLSPGTQNYFNPAHSQQQSLDQKDHDIQVLTDHLNKAYESLNNLESENLALSNTLHALQRSLTNATQTNAGVFQRLETATQLVKEKSKTITDLSHQNTQLRSELDDLTTNCDNLTLTNAQFQKQIESLQTFVSVALTPLNVQIKPLVIADQISPSKVSPVGKETPNICGAEYSIENTDLQRSITFRLERYEYLNPDKHITPNLTNTTQQALLRLQKKLPQALSIPTIPAINWSTPIAPASAHVLWRYQPITVHIPDHDRFKLPNDHLNPTKSHLIQPELLNIFFLNLLRIVNEESPAFWGYEEIMAHVKLIRETCLKNNQEHSDKTNAFANKLIESYDTKVSSLEQQIATLTAELAEVSKKKRSRNRTDQNLDDDGAVGDVNANIKKQRTRKHQDRDDILIRPFEGLSAQYEQQRLPNSLSTGLADVDINQFDSIFLRQFPPQNQFTHHNHSNQQSNQQFIHQNPLPRNNHNPAINSANHPYQQPGINKPPHNQPTNAPQYHQPILPLNSRFQPMPPSSTSHQRYPLQHHNQPQNNAEDEEGREDERDRFEGDGAHEFANQGEVEEDHVDNYTQHDPTDQFHQNQFPSRDNFNTNHDNFDHSDD